MARPKLDLDEQQIEDLAEINCTVEEIASVMRCDKRTLERRYAASIKRGREQGRSSLRRMMWGKCKEGNVTMMIWLSKQILGYTDKMDTKLDIPKPFIIEKSNGNEVILGSGLMDHKKEGE